MRLLIVEDEAKFATYLSRGLSEHGYVADVAGNGEDGLEMARSSDFDLIILDVMLPQRDGFSVLESLRNSGKLTPVIFLTARDSVEDRVRGLEMGADDYLVKPFDLNELAARLRALMRRRGGAATGREASSATPIVGYGDIELNPATREVTQRGVAIELPPREFALLAALMNRPGTILSRAQLEEKLYGWDDAIESNAVEVHIHALRKKLGADSIRNVRGVGWMLAKASAAAA